MFYITSCFILVVVLPFLPSYCEFLQRNPRFYEITPTDNWFKFLNNNLQGFNKISANIAWRLMTGDDDNGTLQSTGTAIALLKTHWKNSMCDTGAVLEQLSPEEKRMYMLMCRGARYTKQQAKEVSDILDNMSAEYSSAEVCVPEDSWPITLLNLQQKSIEGRVCLKGEPDLETLMTRQDLNPNQLLWVWKSWHDTVGPEIFKYYPRLVEVLNEAAANNEYRDIGEVWKEELEIPNLEETVTKLYKEIQPLYMMLHAVIRHALHKKYGPNIVDPMGPIPAHLLGNMWAQDWSALINLLIPKKENLDLDNQIRRKNWTIPYMVEIAEDMYRSLGLPRMTKKFWKYSKFQRDDKNSSLCHGTAANMFDTDDYRILLCAKLNMQDFYVIHHEMGHIEYYMAYKDQPTLFQDGANSAFQESIGDAIMTGVMVPQHLYRLGLLTDEQLFDKKLDIKLLLQQALSKIPQIPHALLIDLYRWNIFNGKITPDTYNSDFWYMNEKLRGIVPPETRNEEYFDAASKFHVPDNTPYIRYFLSAILQMQMFKGMCEITLYGNVTTNQKENEAFIPFPLYKCDIYGSKNAGTKLKKILSLGASEHWSKPLEILTGRNDISVKPLMEYYEPIIKWLKKYISSNNVFVGW